ncbi:hypothetical protein J6590_099361 [Homalodisca vitripennis]|nr:hypothetical protein J6590_099361 [Homalodisca vitripennis]
MLQCMVQSWYLACDMQFFMVGSVLVYVLWRWPRLGQTLLHRNLPEQILRHRPPRYEVNVALVTMIVIQCFHVTVYVLHGWVHAGVRVVEVTTPWSDSPVDHPCSLHRYHSHHNLPEQILRHRPPLSVALCMVQSWYLACDMQFFMVGSMLVYVLWRWPRLGQTLLWTTLVVSIATPAIITYQNRYYGTVLHSVLPW